MDIDLCGIQSLEIRDKGGRTHDVEGSHAKETFGIKDAVFFQDFGDDGDGRVDGVGNNEEVGLGAVSGGVRGRWVREQEALARKQSLKGRYARARQRKRASNL